MRKQSDRCLNCGETRKRVRDGFYLCEKGYTDHGGEWFATRSWSRHRWVEPRQLSADVVTPEGNENA